jgi:acetyl-CoA acyltransferase
MGKATTAFSRAAEVFDTTIGWRFVNPLLEERYGVDSMPETAENVAEEFKIPREDQDRFAAWSQAKAEAAGANGNLAEEITPVTVARRKQDPLVVDTDEHPRPGTTVEKLAKLRPLFRENGTVTAGNASGVNDGACALLVASKPTAERHGLRPLVRVVAMSTAGVPPRIMGFAPAPAVKKVLDRTGMSLDQMDVIELNEAFASQALAVTRELGLDDDDRRVNPNGGAIALGHPLGMSGARLVTTALYQLLRSAGRFALCTMCIGVGQGIAMIIERVDGN